MVKFVLKKDESITAYTYDEAQSLKKEIVWQNLAKIAVEVALKEWLAEKRSFIG